MTDRHPQVINASEHHTSMLPAARGLNRVEAARYVGVSPVTFDKLVTEGTMPRPLRVFARRIWDRRRLDQAMDALALDDDEAPNPWDGAA